MFTQATCLPGSGSALADIKDPITQPFSCIMEPEKHRCIAGGGSCHIGRDG